MNKFFFALISGALLVAISCNNNNTTDSKTNDSTYAATSILSADSSTSNFPLRQTRMESIRSVLTQPLPILFITGADSNQLKAQRIALTDPGFTANLFDAETKEPYLNEIFNVNIARPQDVPKGYNGNTVYRVEMYNYALNGTNIAFVDLSSGKTISVNNYPNTQPDLNATLTNLATQIASHSPDVIKALGYQPADAEALMTATKTSLNRTKCERSMHLCVAPTFIKNDKALWAIVDLTDLRVVGIRWTNVGNSSAEQRISERKLLFDKIMECNCKEIKKIDKNGWKMNYVITSSDGLRISEVYFGNKLIINNAKLVDWHVSYSGTDGFGYSDAVGCPEFSQAAVVAASEPKISELVQDGKTAG